MTTQAKTSQPENGKKGYAFASGHQISWITPLWPAPLGVKAASTLRKGGFSRSPYNGLNLGSHIGDDRDAVKQNRQQLKSVLSLPGDPVWLQQVHGAKMVRADTVSVGVSADGSYTDTEGVVCAIMTADCLPVLLCERQGRAIAAVHAGWRGLVHGVLESAVQKMNSENLMAWLGPVIGRDQFEVGDEVRQIFADKSEQTSPMFRAQANGKWFADLAGLADITLRIAGIREVYHCDLCTFSNPELFYSYRRDTITGRMATLIWKEGD